MRSKLTLLLEKNVINNAKTFAQKNNISIAQLVSDYFSTICGKNLKPKLFSPILKEISGIIAKKTTTQKLKKEYKTYLKKKYL